MAISDIAWSRSHSGHRNLWVADTKIYEKRNVKFFIIPLSGDYCGGDILWSPGDHLRITHRGRPHPSPVWRQTQFLYLSLCDDLVSSVSFTRERCEECDGGTPDKRLLMRVSGLSGHVTVVTVVTGASLQIHFTFLTDTLIRGFQT